MWSSFMRLAKELINIFITSWVLKVNLHRSHPLPFRRRGLRQNICFLMDISSSKSFSLSLILGEGGRNLPGILLTGINLRFKASYAPLILVTYDGAAGQLPTWCSWVICYKWTRGGETCGSAKTWLIRWLTTTSESFTFTMFQASWVSFWLTDLPSTEAIYN